MENFDFSRLVLGAVLVVLVGLLLMVVGTSQERRQAKKTNNVNQVTLRNSVDSLMSGAFGASAVVAIVPPERGHIDGAEAELEIYRRDKEPVTEDYALNIARGCFGCSNDELVAVPHGGYIWRVGKMLAS